MRNLNNPASCFTTILNCNFFFTAWTDMRNIAMIPHDFFGFFIGISCVRAKMLFGMSSRFSDSIFQHSDIITGPEAERSFTRYRTDLAFISACALDDRGLLDVDSPSASMIFRIAENTDKLIFIADHSKFRRKAYARGPAWEDIDVLITDFDPENHERLKEIRARGVEVIIVPNAE